MLNTSARASWVTMKYYNHVLNMNKSNKPAATTYNLGQVIIKLGQTTRTYSSKKVEEDSCCKEISQTAGRRIEDWPQGPEPAIGSPCGPNPPNYDPYKIKVPEVVVPPMMPPFKVKETSNEKLGLFDTSEINMSSVANNNIRDLFHNSPILHPDYWREKPARKISYKVEEDVPRLGYHGKTKYMYAFHEPWNPLDRMSLLAKAEKEEDGEELNEDQSTDAEKETAETEKQLS